MNEKDLILIVDDEPVNNDLLRNILEDDYRIRIATNGNIALKAAGVSPPPDLILMDVMMPEMDGYEACRRLKANPVTQNIPVLFITAKNQEEDEEASFEAGGVDYVTKPVNPRTVKHRVRAQLALHNQRKELARQVREKTAEINLTRLEIIRRLAVAGELKDNETGKHVERVSRYARLIAEKLGLDEEMLEMIEAVAPMHDVGKIGIPDNIINKPGLLDTEERAFIETHPDIGARIMGNMDNPLINLARDIALTHHEKWNGTGYPQRLKGEEIPLAGRIVAVTDVFDALSSKRPYKEPWPPERIWALLEEEKGEHFDPAVVDAFISLRAEVEKIQQELSD